MKTLSMGLLFSAIVLVPGLSRSGDIATNTTQTANGGILTVITAIDAAIQEASEKIEEYEKIAKKTMNAGTIARVPGIDQIMDQVKDMENTIRQGEAVVHSTLRLEELMKAKYKTYEEYSDIIRDIDGDGIGRRPEDFTARYKDWSETHNQTIRNILKSHGIQAAQYDTEKDRFESLRKLSQKTEGRMQALQIGNEIATEELLQLTKLREIAMEQTDLHANYFAMKRAAESEKAAFSEFSREILLGIIDGDEVAYPILP